MENKVTILIKNLDGSVDQINLLRETWEKVKDRLSIINVNTTLLSFLSIEGNQHFINVSNVARLSEFNPAE